MCGGWACASYQLACDNPPLSTLRFTGREFIPTPCGPRDKCFVEDKSRSRGNCQVPQPAVAAMNPCLEFNIAQAEPNATSAKDHWKTAYEKVKDDCSPAFEAKK